MQLMTEDRKIIGTEILLGRSEKIPIGFSLGVLSLGASGIH